MEPNDNIDVESSDSRGSQSNGTEMDIELFSGKLLIQIICFYFNY